MALYKYLLDYDFTLEDLAELHPVEGRSLGKRFSVYRVIGWVISKPKFILESILDYAESDLEDVFCLTFTITIKTLGYTEEVELKRKILNFLQLIF